MAIIVKKGALGTLSGKIGNVVVTKWRDQDVGKETPTKRRRNKKKPQSEQSLRLGLVTHFLSPFREYVKIGFEKKTNKSPGFQTAVEHILKHAVTGQHPDFAIDYKKAVFSQGPLDMAWAAKYGVEQLRGNSCDLGSTGNLKNKAYWA